jgi:NADPH:quinone reductase-like Zn-dependent oxidoreductase
MMNTIHATMRAIGQDTYGSPEVLKEIELPRPEPGLSEILVAVRAAGVNPTDWKNRAQVATIERLPLVLGWDVSGVVEAIGLGATLFKPGDEVSPSPPIRPSSTPPTSGPGSGSSSTRPPAASAELVEAIVRGVAAVAEPLARRRRRPRRTARGAAVSGGGRPAAKSPVDHNITYVRP